MENLFSFEGRMGRRDFFFMFIAIWIVLIVFTLIGQEVLLFIVWCIGILLHSCNTVKRLHDLNRPGVHYWLSLIPIYTIYFVIVLFTRKGTAGANIYSNDLTNEDQK